MFRTVFKHNLFFHIKKQKTKNKKQKTNVVMNLREQCS